MYRRFPTENQGGFLFYRKWFGHCWWTLIAFLVAPTTRQAGSMGQAVVMGLASEWERWTQWWDGDKENKVKWLEGGSGRAPLHLAWLGRLQVQPQRPPFLLCRCWASEAESVVTEVKWKGTGPCQPVCLSRKWEESGHPVPSLPTLDHFLSCDPAAYSVCDFFPFSMTLQGPEKLVFKLRKSPKEERVLTLHQGSSRNLLSSLLL